MIKIAPDLHLNHAYLEVVMKVNQVDKLEFLNIPPQFVNPPPYVVSYDFSFDQKFLSKLNDKKKNQSFEVERKIQLPKIKDIDNS